MQFGADLGKLLEGLLVPGLAFLPVLHDLGGQLAHVFDEAFTLTLETLLHGLTLFAGTLLLGLERIKFAFALGGQGVQAIHHRRHILTVQQQILFRTAQYRFGEPVLAGHVQRLTRADLIVGQPEQRLFRARIEQHRSGTHALTGQRVGFQGRKMRRGHHMRPAFEEAVEHGLSQRGPLRGVGAGAELVEQDERAAIRGFPCVAEMPDLRRKRGKMIIKALLVADERVDRRPPRDDGTLRRRDRQSGERHDRQQTERLEAYGLAARVAAADDERAIRGPENEVHRMRAALLADLRIEREKRVTRAEQG